MNCPKCHKEVKGFYRVWSDKAFTAKEALPGLIAWDGLDVQLPERTAGDETEPGNS